MNMNVNAASLNLRSDPVVKPSNILAALPFGHPVTVIGNATRPGWKTVATTHAGATLSGVVSGGFLRDRLSGAKEQLLAAGVVEWERFERGKKKEAGDPQYKYVGEMWRAIGMDLDGRDTGWPWSAACISFIIRQAGYTGFTFAAAHSRYIHEAIAGRNGNDVTRDYWGYRLNEHKPAIGDLVCRKRTTDTITYDYAAQHHAFLSHTDIVIAIGADFVDAVGGNVSNSVSITRYKLDTNGYLSTADGKVFAVLKNRR